MSGRRTDAPDPVSPPRHEYRGRRRDRRAGAGRAGPEPDLPGLWIGVWDPAKGFYTQASGEAVKGGAKATSDDHGRIGRETKTFTVVAVLAQAGTAAVQRSADLDQALLTGREREVPRLLAQGWRTKEIAGTLGISAKMVETYRARIMMKLRIDTLAGLVRFAIRAGIAPVE